jgi:very-short-patch-repair endonuclease
MSNFSEFLTIRKAYAKLLPVWMDEYEKTGDMRQDPYFMDWKFTPIENHVWGDIRTLGLPFYPQIPVLNYFIDFGCPFLKIGIECDGKAWHNSEKDAARDARLAADGWMIFRIEGHECHRVIEPWEEFEEEERAELVADYFLATSEGIVSAIKRRHFDDDQDGKYAYLIDSTLFEHLSTPETNLVRRPAKKTTGPILLRDALVGYAELLAARSGVPA